jgi:hypothetical protein
MRRCRRRGETVDGLRLESSLGWTDVHLRGRRARLTEVDAPPGLSFVPQQIMRELSFRLPEASVAVEANEAQRLFEELDRLGARPTGQDYARLARRVGTAAHEQSVHAVELLDVAENEKVLRALEHLAARDELNPGLVSLWEGLTRDVRPVPVTYRLELVHVDGHEEPRDMISLSGSYSVGDLIPAPAGECWQVVNVRLEEDGPIRLTCDPC